MAFNRRQRDKKGIFNVFITFSFQDEVNNLLFPVRNLVFCKETVHPFFGLQLQGKAFHPALVPRKEKQAHQ